MITYTQKIATEHFSPERPGVLHVWSHSAHGLRWSDEDRRFILLFLIARLRATGFTLFAINVLHTLASPASRRRRKNRPGAVFIPKGLHPKAKGWRIAYPGKIRRDPEAALHIAISYVENNGVDAGLAETSADDPFSGIGHTLPLNLCAQRLGLRQVLPP
jgi:hypothetical protein